MTITRTFKKKRKKKAKSKEIKNNPQIKVRKNAPGAGRPIKWTKEAIEEEAKELIKWAKKKDSFYVKYFAADRNYSPQRLTEWIAENEKFSDAYEKVNTLLEKRIVSGSITNEYNAGFAKFLLQAKYDYKIIPTTVVNYNAQTAEIINEDEVQTAD